MIQPKFNTSMTGVPILKNATIENDAERLLQDYNPALLEAPQALNVEDFTENYLGLKIHYDNLAPDGSIWGCIVFFNSLIPVYVPKLRRTEHCAIDGGTVMINKLLLKEGHETSFRSTMMHECGHKLYHTQYYRQESPPSIWLSAAREHVSATACRHVDILGSNSTLQRSLLTDKDWLEHHAKLFSAATLMPASMVRRIYDDCCIGLYFSDGCDGYEKPFIEYAASVFHVSVRSAAIRVRQLKLDYESYKATHPIQYGKRRRYRLVSGYRY